MKLEIKIIGPKVHDVGYRYFLLGIAMSNRIRMFEAHNTKSSEGEEVVVFADGDEAAIKAFCNQVETERPVRSKVSNIVFDDFDGLFSHQSSFFCILSEGMASWKRRHRSDINALFRVSFYCYAIFQGHHHLIVPGYLCH
jgi:acylphosphatase